MDKKTEKGGISVETQHIFPIIKRWLYSDKEIFLRELVSNACDAITKLKRLSSLGEAKDIEDNFKICVKLDEENKTLTVSDNGIGMTSDEVKQYINQIALSGALDFIKKYEGEDATNGIIGHFGLGFYSAFMIADRVEIITKSFTGADAVHWECTEDGSFEMGEGEKEARGTDIILHVNDDEQEYLSASRLKTVLEKYCSFVPVEIYFDDGKEKKEDEGDKPINDICPLWQKNPSDCSKEEYIEFYKKTFHDFRDPLFYIHIKADYPLNFKGILYFPQVSHEYQNIEGEVKLYYNQMFVADNIKEVVPEYLLMLKGVLDCPEIPLNVSRSFLQNSGYVSKISSHIVKKVGDKIADLFNNSRSDYEGFYDQIKPFVEYGCMRDKKFYDRTKNFLLFKTTDEAFTTLDEYTSKLPDGEKAMYYATDPVQQSKYISMLKEQGCTAVLLPSMIDTQFIQFLETENKDIKFKRVDSDVLDAVAEKGEATVNEVLSELFKKAIGKENTEIEFSALKDEKTPAIITVSEEQRRFADMMKMYQAAGQGFSAPDMPTGEKIILNVNNSIIKKIESIVASDDKKAQMLAKEVYMLALLNQRSLSADELSDFVSSTNSILENL